MIEHDNTGSLDVKEDKLCFDKNEFLKTNFSVDEFLHKNRNVSSLELLRDNLGLYLKSLRASMIDLINEDYADFVSLSANLVGFDQSIDTIETPLDNFREDITRIQVIIDENINEINAKLNSKRQLRELKRNLQSLKKVHETIQKLEDLLANQLSCTQVKSADLERAALELVQLKFNEKFCLEYLDEKQLNIIRKLESSVHQKLRTLLNESLNITNATSTDLLERCLRIFITLDACSVAEIAFKEDFVAPYMRDIICEHNLQQTPQGLAAIYSKVLNFISLYMTDLLRLTQYTDKFKGFNFLINSFWSDVEMRLETHMSSIFAPGNSEVFYAKYKCTRDFLSKIEEILVNKNIIATFRQHKQTKSFQARWNLPVYFQICFQEIAGQFESVLDPTLTEESLINSSEQQYELKSFNHAGQSINRCWSEGIFLSELFPKFYKLHIQIILRLSHWINDVLNILNTNNSSNSMQSKKLKILVVLHSDINKLLCDLVQQQETVLNSLFSSLTQERGKQLDIAKNAVEKSFGDLNDILNQHLIEIQNLLIDSLILTCGPENIRQVNDLPRLYRKTNRELPTRCSAYVEQMLKPLKFFSEEYKTKLSKHVVQKVLKKVLNRITSDYLLAVNEVLTSVQKTEESLRRLKNLKGGTSSTSLPSQTSVSVISDDDKIRLQLRVDVSAWTNELSNLEFMPSDVNRLVELNNVVEESIKSR